MGDYLQAQPPTVDRLPVRHSAAILLDQGVDQFHLQSFEPRVRRASTWSNMTISPSLFILTLLVAVQVVHSIPLGSGIWHVSILEAPAPPPDKGPPLSAHALRDRSKLSYEIAGIVAAYVVWTAVTVVLILFIGRRLRRKAQTSLRTLNMEIVKPTAKQPGPGTGPSPTSPIKQWASPATTFVNSLKSPKFGHQSKTSHASVSTFDDRILEQDKARNMDEMEKLYAAVMAHDVKKSPPKQNNGFEHAPLKSPAHGPAELQYLRTDSNAVHSLSHPLAPSPTSPVDEYSRPATTSRTSSKMTKAVSFLSSANSRASSANSNKSRPSRISIRGLPISQPMGSSDLRQSIAYDEEQPLSPRQYTPGPPPLTPAMKSAAAQARELDGRSTARAPPPAPLPLRATAATNSNRSLPFRDAYSPPQSAPATKVTYLEKRDSVLHPAPKTGVPHTPYTPYQPFTPITPITPGRLVTKDEMKRSRKQQGMKVLSEDDVVQADEDMWQ